MEGACVGKWQRKCTHETKGDAKKRVRTIQQTLCTGQITTHTLYTYIQSTDRQTETAHTHKHTHKHTHTHIDNNNNNNNNNNKEARTAVDDEVVGLMGEDTVVVWVWAALEVLLLVLAQVCVPRVLLSSVPLVAV
jgi:hypothetical protein